MIEYVTSSSSDSTVQDETATHLRGQTATHDSKANKKKETIEKELKKKLNQ